METDGQFYFCEGCNTWQPFMGRDVTCDCGYSNEFEESNYIALEDAVDEAAEDDLNEEDDEED